MLRLLFVCFAFLPMCLSAQVSVRTGEHETFSRIVITIPPDTNWRIGTTTDGYGVAFDDDVALDLSGFFDRIPRDRISNAAIDPERAALLLSLGCECGIDAFQWQPNKLVVDVTDAANAAGTAFDQPLFAGELVSMLPDESLTQAIELSEAFTEGLPDRMLTSSHPVTLQDDILEDAELEAEVSSLEASVVATLARAASQGLLTPSANLSVTRTQSPLPTVRQTDQLKEPQTPDFVADTPGIRIQSSIDRALQDAADSAVTQSGATCWPDKRFDVASWAAGGDFSSQIGPLRTNITMEFDEVENKDVTALAQAYIYFGFGREARQVLQLATERTPDWFALVSLAQIIDDDPVNPPIPQEQMSCPNAASFWAFLGQDKRDLNIAIDRTSIIRTFRALPLHLQLHLAPRVSARFVELGDLSAAETILTNTNREKEPSFDGALAQIDIEIARGDVQSAANELQNLASETARMTPQALLDLLTLNLRNEVETPEDILLLSSAMRFENAGHPVVGDLAVAEVESHLRNLNFQDAGLVIEGALDDIGEARAAILKDSFARRMVEVGSDAAFLDFAFDTLPEGVSNESLNLVARRLIDIGFPDQARDILEGPAVGAAMAERRYLRAQAALAMGELEEAENILTGVSSARAVRLRREIVAQEDGFRLASSDAEAPNEVGDEDAWRSGNWQILTETDDTLLQTAADLVLVETPEDISVAAPLQQSRTLLDQSAETRAVLDQLLLRFQEPTAIAAVTN